MIEDTMFDNDYYAVFLEEHEKENGMSELKLCPYRVYGERRASLTVAGEFFYNEYFAPCMRRECACFHVDCGEAYCNRNGSYMYLGELEADDGPNRCCDGCGHYDTCARNKVEERNEQRSNGNE